MSDEVISERFEVVREIAAPPDEVFAVVCSPQGHVAIDASGMLQSAEGEPVTAAGDTFLVHMDRESLNDLPLGRYDVTVVIHELEPGRHVQWGVTGAFGDIGHRYGYVVEPAAIGSRVTAYYDWSRIRDDIREIGIFPVIPELTLRASLGILARTVEHPATSG